MADIKTREIKKGTIKTLNRANVMLEKSKDTIVKIKDSQNKDMSGTEYAQNEISNSFSHVTHRRNK